MKVFFALLAVVLTIFVFSCKEELQIYRIGALVPLSGAAEGYGRNVKNGMMLALDEINKTGGIKGKPMDIIIEDDGSDDKQAVRKTDQLISSSHVPVIIGGVTSSVALAAEPECEKNKVVLLSPTASSPKLTGIGKYFFRIYPSDNLEGRSRWFQKRQEGSR